MINNNYNFNRDSKERSRFKNQNPMNKKKIVLIIIMRFWKLFKEQRVRKKKKGLLEFNRRKKFRGRIKLIQ